MNQVLFFCNILELFPLHHDALIYFACIHVCSFKKWKNPYVKFVSVHLYFDVELVLLKHGFLILSLFHFMSISLSYVQAWTLFYHDVLLIWTFWFYYYTIIVTDLFSLSIIKKKSIISFYHFGKKTPMDSIKMAPVCKNTFSTFFHVVWWILIHDDIFLLNVCVIFVFEIYIELI